MALNVHRAITESAKEVNGIIGQEVAIDAVAWPNKVPIEHKLDSNGEPLPFLELVFGASDITPLTLSRDNGVDRVNGAFVINIRYATNRGAVAADDMASMVLGYYYNGKEFAYEGQSVRVVATSLEPGAPDFGWYKVSVIIKYVAHQKRGR
jgi:hypothetical protein